MLYWISSASSISSSSALGSCIAWLILVSSSPMVVFFLSICSRHFVRMATCFSLCGSSLCKMSSIFLRTFVTCPRWALREAQRREISSINYAAVNLKESTTTKCSIQIGSLALRGTVNMRRYQNFSMAGYNRSKNQGKTNDPGYSTNVTDNIVVGHAVELYNGEHPTSILTRALTQRSHVILMYAHSNLCMRNK